MRLLEERLRLKKQAKVFLKNRRDSFSAKIVKKEKINRVKMINFPQR
jgi:hypothetical protein